MKVTANHHIIFVSKNKPYLAAVNDSHSGSEPFYLVLLFQLEAQ